MTIRRPPLGVALIGAPAIAIVLTAVTLSSTPAAEQFNGHPVAPGEALVAFRDAPDVARLRVDVDGDADAIGADARLWHARSRTKTARALIAALSARRDVVYVEPNYLVSTTRQPNDPRFAELWGLLNVGQPIGGPPGGAGADIAATLAWARAIGA